MKVSELIESLQQFDPTLAVLVRGYEGGYEYVTGSSEKLMLLDVHSDRDKEWYYGPHEIADDYYGETDKDGKKRERANCVLIGQKMYSFMVFVFIFAVLIFVLHKVWEEIKADTNCSQDCDQGRKCDCKEKEK